MADGQQMLHDLETLEQHGQLPDQHKQTLADLRTAFGAPQSVGDVVGQTLKARGIKTTAQAPIAETIGATVGGIGAPVLLGTLLGGPVGAGLGLAAGVGGSALGDIAGQAMSSDILPTAGEAAGAGVRGAAGELIGRGVGSALGAAGRYTGISGKLSDAAQSVMEAAQRFKIPMMAGDITLSKPTRMLENFPTYFAIGSGAVQKAREAQLGAAGEAAGNVLLQGAQEAADNLTAGIAAQGGVRKGVQAFRQQADQLFRHVESLAGPEPVVPTTNIRAAASKLLGEAQEAPFGVPTGTRKLAGPANTGIPALDEALQKATAGDLIDFATARRIESQVGQMAFGSRAPTTIGTIQQGQAASLYKAIRADLDAYMTSPSGAEVAPALAEAKQAYSTGKELFNNSMSKVVLGGKKTPVRPEDVLGKIFKPGSITNTLDFKLAVSDDVYQGAVKAWKQGLYDNAFNPDGTYSPAKFVREIAKYTKNGHLDVILPPDEAADLKALEMVNARLGTAERIAGNPSGTGQAMQASRQLMNIARATASVLGGGAGYEYGGQHPYEAAALGTMAPLAVGKFVTSAPGIHMLTQGVGQTLGPTAARLGGQAASQMFIPDLLKGLGQGPPTP